MTDVQLAREVAAHARTKALVERLRATPTPEDLWMEVRVSEEGQSARHFRRMYGRASATIGAQRDLIARLRAERDQARAFVAEQATQPCAPDDPAEFRRRINALQQRVTPPSCECGDDTGPGLHVQHGVVGARCIDQDVINERVCARCLDPVHTLSSRDWCDGCEEEEDRAKAGSGARRLESPSSPPPAHPADTAKVGGPDPTSNENAALGCHRIDPIDLWSCTRNAGHRGQHVAGTSDGLVQAVWPNETSPGGGEGAGESSPPTGAPAPGDTDADPADTARVRDRMPNGWDAAQGSADEDLCSARHSVFTCTRRKGHRGQHLAGAGLSVCDVWPNNQDVVVAKTERYGDELGQRDPDTITWAEIEDLALLLFEAEVQFDNAPDAYAALDDANRAALRGQAQHVLRSGRVHLDAHPAPPSGAPRTGSFAPPRHPDDRPPR